MNMNRVSATHKYMLQSRSKRPILHIFVGTYVLLLEVMSLSLSTTINEYETGDEIRIDKINNKRLDKMNFDLSKP